MTLELTRFTADCSQCAGLCCVALERPRAGGFGEDVPAGTPCRHLADDNRCRIHATLRQDGWPACAVFDCFGAGQQVTRVGFGGADWRTDPGTRRDMFATFEVMRHLMEMLRLLVEAEELATGELTGRVRDLREQLERLVAAPAPDVVTADVTLLRGRVGPLLGEASEQARTPAPQDRRLKPRAQLLGADLRGGDLSRMTLRSALLIAADLRQATFDRTDLLGADLRDADLRGADLGGALFLSQQQVSAARGDRTTRLPAHLRRPDHW